MKDEPTPNLEKQLEQYTYGNLPACNHPIKAVDDNNFCHKCGKQLLPHISEIDQLHARIAELTAANDSMQEDAVNNTATINMLMAQLAEVNEENRGLRQMLHMEQR